MIIKILSLIKNYKKIGYIIGAVTVIGTLYLGYQNFQDKYFQQGYSQAKQEYDVMVAEAVNKNRVEYELRLVKLRQSLRQQAVDEQARRVAEVATDKEVVKVVEYIERKIYVKKECNTVDPVLISLFNDSVSRVNSSGEDKP
jgi:hypothetical protein